MKLIIKRDQDRGFLGGMSFVLSCKVELTEDEQNLISKYKAHKEVLTTRKFGDSEIPDLKIGDLVQGVTYKAKDITQLLNNEVVIKGACQHFKDYLIVMASFGGQEILEF